MDFWHCASNFWCDLWYSVPWIASLKLLTWNVFTVQIGINKMPLEFKSERDHRDPLSQGNEVQRSSGAEQSQDLGLLNSPASYSFMEPCCLLTWPLEKSNKLWNGRLRNGDNCKSKNGKGIKQLGLMKSVHLELRKVWVLLGQVFFSFPSLVPNWNKGQRNIPKV